MNRTLKLKVADQVSTLNPASEDGISDMTIKVHIEDEDVYRILITKLKKQVSVINVEDVND